MTDNYFILAGLCLFIYIFVWDSPLVLIAITALVTLGLLSGYGVLPAWQG